MSTQRYSVTPRPIETILTWVKSGEIAIPEIQRPFVWEATKVRNLLDSLYQGYPVGYLIAWRNPTVKLKDGTTSAGKRILIDGQPPCCETERNLDSLNSVSYSESLYHRDITTPDRFERQRMCHSYMNGMHNVEIQLTGHNCSTPFQFNAYRIR